MKGLRSITCIHILNRLLYLTDNAVDIIENCLYILWKHLEFYLVSYGTHSSKLVTRHHMRNLKGNDIIVQWCMMYCWLYYTTTV